jgi:hypothetical protein
LRSILGFRTDAVLSLGPGFAKQRTMEEAVKGKQEEKGRARENRGSSSWRYPIAF